MTENWKFGHIIASSFLVLIMLMFILQSAGCTQKAFVHPDAIIFEYPLSVSLEQISSEYTLDPVKADAKYKGRRLVFNSIEVDEVHTIYYQSGGAIAASMVDYFSAGMVRFQLLDYRGVQQRVQAGYVLNLDGICQGLVGNFISIKDCWVGSVKGDLGLGLPPVFQY